MTTRTLVNKFQRNDTEQLQITKSTYKEKDYVDIRLFFKSKDGSTYLPTKKGITLTVDSLEIDFVVENLKKLQGE